MILGSVIMVVLLLVVGILSPASQSLRFELQSGHTKCVSEDIKSDSMTVGKYHVVNPNQDHPLPDSHKLTVRVALPKGNTYHRAEKVKTGQFAFTAAEEGGYTACFWADDHSPRITLTVDFDWRTGVHAKDWSNIAREGHVVVMELELNKLYDVVTSIEEEMFYLRAREEEMLELNKATTSKMFWLSLLSLFLCLSVAGLQFWHLKAFFEKKKLI
ncbi:Transmembrane emp24 domain-containing protein p24delta9 [Hibiscus syriacus]|uniref:Transmembrane emp24 domain-containing protein p24delta9 n=1 Tax=Hibiscus syriacus TaxID=106335 RepID=A0A6A2YRM7_HIBSY|nr:transmembrane emp24 domain-containing protein p24delta9-like [Hibiscus syriacus]KAE8682091.1 Transmembrane emp24 domain-containing protein p24delta9 [Hibiscus syriacus]